MASIREKARRKDGGGQWQVQIRRKGWPVQTKTLRTKRDAEAWARQTEAEMDKGHFVDQRTATKVTFRDLIKLYRDQVTANRPSENSRVSETLRLNYFLRENKALCAHSVLNLTPEHFIAWRDERLKQRNKQGKLIAPGTVKRELTTLRRVIDNKKRQLGLLINPVNTEDVKRPAVNDERDVRLTLEERLRLLEACEQPLTPWLRPLVELAFETGARRGNLLRLCWRNVCLQRRTALLRGIKNSRSPDKIINHMIGLTPRAVEILQHLPRDDERVFPISSNAARKGFNRARERAGVEHFRFHDTRHERVSSLFEAGWSMVQVMAQSGHRDPKSVKRYANISGEFLADALSKL